MNVLHVTSGNLYGGVETFLVTLARCRGLVPDMVPEFAVCFRGRLWDELAATGAPVHDLGGVRLSRPWTVLRARRRVRGLAARGTFGAVVCHQPWGQALFGTAGYVAYFHGPAGAGWPEKLARRTRPRLVIAPSRHTLETTKAVFPTTPGAVLNYPLPPAVTAFPEFEPAARNTFRAALGAGPADVVILQASRVERWKGPDLVVRALGRLKDVPGWRFWFAGGAQRPEERAYYDEIRAAAAEEGVIDRVNFLGSRSDVPALMRAADVYTQGNRGPEGFSLSFLEASYSGLPVVTPDLGGANEMIDPGTGVLVPAGEVPALAAALESLIRDPARRAALSAAARAKAVRTSDPARQLGRLRDFLRAPRPA